MNNTILIAKNITKIYGLGTSYPIVALEDISLTVNKGDFLCIMGPSGSGKSTFINNLSTIDIPTKGKVYINGTEVRTMSGNKIGEFRYKNLGFVFQEFNLIDCLSIEENISLPLTLEKNSSEMIKQKVYKIAEKMNIEDLLKKFPNECSGGQRQRVAIARALVNNPELIIADEPTGNLDSKNSHELLELFKQLNSEGVSILMVTHDPMNASYSSKVLFLKDGRIQQTLERGDLSQKEYFYKIVEINSSESQKWIFK